MTVLCSNAAWANGGAGGFTPEFGNAGSGAGGYNGTNGSGGTEFSVRGCNYIAYPAGGGGGGGGGAGGGAGGNAAVDGYGAAGGTSISPNGQSAVPFSGYFSDGLQAIGVGGGGGGGGFNGNGAGVEVLHNLSPLAGGNGGNGADAPGQLAGNGWSTQVDQGGGGGGAGGYGAIVTGATINSNAVSIIGGNGGNGGLTSNCTTQAFAYGGGGGDGGVGALFAASNATLVNTGTIVGGNGGQGGGVNIGYSVPGAVGAGGAGVVGAGLTINNSGTISGGLAGDQTTRAYGIVLTGGVNYVGGSGTIIGGINVTDGTFQPSLPGSPVGTPLAINGPLTLSSNATYQVRVTPTASGSVSASGAANLNGANLNIVVAAPLTQNGLYFILSAAGGINSTFSNVTTSAFYATLLSYNGNSVWAVVGPNNPIEVTNTSTEQTAVVPDYRPVAATSNQTALAGALTNANIQRTQTLSGPSARLVTAPQGGSNTTAALSTPSGVTGISTPSSDTTTSAHRAAPLDEAGALLASINQLDAVEARAAFDDLSGEGLTGAETTAHTASALFTSALADATTFYVEGGAPANSITLGGQPPLRELADAPAIRPYAPSEPSRTWRAWGSSFGGSETLAGDATRGTAAQSDTVYGGLLGVDDQVIPGFLAGVALGASSGNFAVPGRQTSGWMDGAHIGLYDLATFGRFYGMSSLTASFFDNHTTRLIAGFGDLASEATHAGFGSWELRGRLEFGRHVAAGQGLEVTPFVALEIATLRTDGFSETAQSGALLQGLDVPGQTSPSVPTFLGARLARPIDLSGLLLTPTVQLAYVHDFAPEHAFIASLAGVPNSTFLIDGAPAARNAAQAKLGGELALTRSILVSADFDSIVSGSTHAYAGQGSIKVLW